MTPASKPKRIREHGQYLTYNEMKSRAFNRRAHLFLTGGYLTQQKKRSHALKMLTARVCNPETTTIHIRIEDK